MLYNCGRVIGLVVAYSGLLTLTASKTTGEKSDNTIPSLQLKFAWTVLEARYPLSAKGAEPKTLRSCEGEKLAIVSSLFYGRLKTARTGRLLNGQFVTVVRCDGNKDTDSRTGFMMQSELVELHGNPVWPFISLTAKGLTPGTTAYIKALADIDLPLNQTHNGCVQGSELTNLYDSDNAILYVQVEQFGKEIMDQLDVRKVNVEVKKCKPEIYKFYDLSADIQHVPPAPDSNDSDSPKGKRPHRSINGKGDDVVPNDQLEENDENPKESSADLSSLPFTYNNVSTPDSLASNAAKFTSLAHIWYTLVGLFMLAFC
ncbi:hypothetical protein IWQ61_009046 [Dispira simplex]|nr:hypothetical protein IWQ61_009046 [Dispira simplex]